MCISAWLWNADPFTTNQSSTGVGHGRVTGRALARFRCSLLYPRSIPPLFMFGNRTIRTSQAFLSPDGHSYYFTLGNLPPKVSCYVPPPALWGAS